MSGTAPAGWYKDPAGTPGRLRFFDGRRWTDRVRDTTPPRPAPGPTPLPGAALTAPTRTPGDGLAPASSWTAGVAPGTTQALLAQVAADWAPKERPTWAEAGWYPDPGRSRKLRFYDGDGWTGRIRTPLEAQMRSLPKAVVAARARLLAAADTHATRSQHGARWRTLTPVRVEQPQSLHRVVRGKSGRVGGMLSMAAVVVAAAMLMFAGWQQFGADTWQQRNQEDLRAHLLEQFTTAGGDYDEGLTVSGDPTPVDIDRPTLPTEDPTHPPSEPGDPTIDPGLPAPGDPTTRPGRTPGPTQTPRPAPTGPAAGPRADVTPFPPARWSPPPGRRVRNLAGFGLGAPVGRLVIPRIGLDEVMVSGTGANELAKGPGVARYAMLPGSPGNAVIAGHRTGWGEPFRHLDKLRYGDQIIVEVPGQQRAVYEVRAQVVVGPTNTNVVRQTGGVRLTLTTCTPVGVNTHRLVIQAEMISGPWLDRAVNRSKFRTLR